MLSWATVVMTAYVGRHVTMAFAPRRLVPFKLRQNGLNGLIGKTFCSISQELPTASTEMTSGRILEHKMTMLGKDVWVLQFDGGSRGNPGRAGSGSVIYKSFIDDESKDGDEKDQKCVFSDSEEMWNGYHYLGESVTNNVAEYSGLIEGLKQAVSMSIPALLIQGDSQLVLYQVEGKYKVKNDKLKPLHHEAQSLLRRIPNYVLEYIPRAQNARADKLSNLAMDHMVNTSVLTTVNGADTHTNIHTDYCAGEEMKNVSDSKLSVSNHALSSSSDLGQLYSDRDEQETKEGNQDFDILFNEKDRTLTITVPVSELKFKTLKQAAMKKDVKTKKVIVIVEKSPEQEIKKENAVKIKEMDPKKVKPMTTKDKVVKPQKIKNTDGKDVQPVKAPSAAMKTTKSTHPGRRKKKPVGSMEMEQGI